MSLIDRLENPDHAAEEHTQECEQADHEDRVDLHEKLKQLRRPHQLRRLRRL